MERALVEGRGLLVRRNLPGLDRSLDRALSAGELQRVLPGIYAPPGDLDLVARARAVTALDPNAIVVGRAAAALTWWPELETATLEAACRGRRDPGNGIRWHQREVPPEHVRVSNGVRFATPTFTILDLLPSMGGRPIDEALRRGVVTLAALEQAFEGLPHRPGNRLRRALIEDSRDEPWSEAERRLHRTYRGLALPYAYRTNAPVVLRDGARRLIDLALPDLLLGFGDDGYEPHGPRQAFIRDRASDAELATLGWQRVRFDAPSVFDDEARVERVIREVVAAREALFRGTRPAGVRVRRAG